MLVFYKYKLGSTMLDGRRIYGYLEAYPPAHISWDVYKANHGNLLQVPYNKRNLEAMFPGRTFPVISFTYYEIRFLSWEQMCALCKALGITTGRRKDSRRRKLRKFFKENC